MEKEISTAIWIALLLGAIVAIAVLIMNVFGSAKGQIQDAADSFTQTSAAFDKSKFDMYDNGKISGTSLRQAIKDYAGKDIAILVNTASVQFKLTGKTGSVLPDNSKFFSSKAALTEANVTVINRLKSEGDTKFTIQISNKDNVLQPRWISIGDPDNDNTQAYIYLNYGAQFDYTSGKIKFDDEKGQFIWDGKWLQDTSTGTIVRWNNMANVKAQNATEYINDAATYQSYHIISATGAFQGFLCYELRD